MTDIRIEPVRSRADWKAFRDLAVRIYANDPCWVRPLELDLKDRLNTERNPFFEHAEGNIDLYSNPVPLPGTLALFQQFPLARGVLGRRCRSAEASGAGRDAASPTGGDVTIGGLSPSRKHVEHERSRRWSTKCRAPARSAAVR